MPFAYDDRLTRGRKRVYRQSDGIAAVPIPRAADVPTLFSERCRRLGCDPLARPDPFRAEGFRRRESSLLRQILPPAPPGARSPHHD
ncbi:MAG: hypothetical protein EHM71_05610 [Zetaproteobacteria bacterium]|nr:MAG: hypothetical protein EHM71_05610 [Zetaproteobacteria bacterium]